jgi:hypothetical protein
MSSPKWLGVGVSMQSAIAATKTLTAITKAVGGVVSSEAHGYSNGDYVLLLVQGMTQVHERVFRISSVATDSFVLEGEDTTLYNTFSSGTAQKLTLGTTFSTLKTISGSGGEWDKLDVTTIHDTIKKIEPGMASAVEFSFDSFWDLADAALIAAVNLSKNQAQAAFLFTFATGHKMAFYGYVGATGVPQGSTGEKVITKLAITASGVPTYYGT